MKSSPHRSRQNAAGGAALQRAGQVIAWTKALGVPVTELLG